MVSLLFDRFGFLFVLIVKSGFFVAAIRACIFPDLSEIYFVLRCSSLKSVEEEDSWEERFWNLKDLKELNNLLLKEEEFVLFLLLGSLSLMLWCRRLDSWWLICQRGSMLWLFISYPACQ